MKKLFLSLSGFIFLTALSLALVLSLTISVDLAQATLIGPNDPVGAGDIDTAANMSTLLGYDVIRLDRWVEGGDLLEGYLIVEEDPAHSGDDSDKYALVSWDLTGTGYSAAAVAVKDGDTPEGTGFKWIYYTVTGDQSIVTLPQPVDTLTNGAGGISHITLYGVEGAAPVPEPATILLLGSGLVGLAGFGRKKFKK